jgi:hypothetical protein
MQCSQLPSFNTVNFIQHVPLTEVHRSESSSKSSSQATTSSFVSSSSPGSVDSFGLMADSTESLRWARIDMQLMHADVKSFLKRRNVKKTSEHFSGHKTTLLRKALKDSIESKPVGDSDQIKTTLMQLVEPKP